MKVDVLNPVVTVQLRGGHVQIKELSWRDCLRAVRETSDSIMKMVVGKELVFDRERIAELITSQEQVLSWVLQKSLTGSLPSGYDGKPQEFIDSLSAREALPLIDAVVQLNLNDEVIGPGKTLAGRLGDLFGLKKLSLERVTTSSVPATASATLTA